MRTLFIHVIIVALLLFAAVANATEGGLTGGCVEREAYAKGPRTPAAKSFAAGSEEEAFFPAASGKTAAPAIATGWSFEQVRKRYPNAKFNLISGSLAGASPVVEVVVADKAQFKLAFGVEGETLLLTKPGEIPGAAVVTAMETQNAAFRTKSGLRVGMSVEAAAEKVASPVLFQEARGGAPATEVLHFGKSAPADLYFSRYSFLVAGSGGSRLGNEVYVGAKGSKGCEVYWTREFKANGTIRSILIQPGRKVN